MSSKNTKKGFSFYKTNLYWLHVSKSGVAIRGSPNLFELHRKIKETHRKMQEPGFWEYYQNARKRNPQDEIVQEVRHYMQRKAASEKQSINYRKMYAA